MAEPPQGRQDFGLGLALGFLGVTVGCIIGALVAALVAFLVVIPGMFGGRPEDWQPLIPAFFWPLGLCTFLIPTFGYAFSKPGPAYTRGVIVSTITMLLLVGTYGRSRYLDQEQRKSEALKHTPEAEAATRFKDINVLRNLSEPLSWQAENALNKRIIEKDLDSETLHHILVTYPSTQCLIVSNPNTATEDLDTVCSKEGKCPRVGVCEKAGVCDDDFFLKNPNVSVTCLKTLIGHGQGKYSERAGVLLAAKSCDPETLYNLSRWPGGFKYDGDAPRDMLIALVKNPCTPSIVFEESPEYLIWDSEPNLLYRQRALTRTQDPKVIKARGWRPPAKSRQVNKQVKSTAHP